MNPYVKLQKNVIILSSVNQDQNQPIKVEKGHQAVIRTTIKAKELLNKLTQL
jgi:hypothetical protein